MNDELKGIRVLVVEDEAMIALMIEDMLTEFGCQMVGPFADLQNAVAAVGGNNFDIALLDVNLNGERTEPVAEILRARNKPFIFATGYGGSGIEGSQVVLTKPFRQDELQAALRKICR